MKEYLCDCDPCCQFDFDNCEKDGKKNWWICKKLTSAF